MVLRHATSRSDTGVGLQATLAHLVPAVSLGQQASQEALVPWVQLA